MSKKSRKAFNCEQLFYRFSDFLELSVPKTPPKPVKITEKDIGPGLLVGMLGFYQYHRHIFKECCEKRGWTLMELRDSPWHEPWFVAVKSDRFLLVISLDVTLTEFIENAEYLDKEDIPLSWRLRLWARNIKKHFVKLFKKA